MQCVLLRPAEKCQWPWSTRDLQSNLSPPCKEGLKSISVSGVWVEVFQTYRNPQTHWATHLAESQARRPTHPPHTTGPHARQRQLKNYVSDRVWPTRKKRVAKDFVDPCEKMEKPTGPHTPSEDPTFQTQSCCSLSLPET